MGAAISSVDALPTGGEPPLPEGGDLYSQQNETRRRLGIVGMTAFSICCEVKAKMLTLEPTRHCFIAAKVAQSIAASST
jgi:hypothetical protein